MFKTSRPLIGCRLCVLALIAAVTSIPASGADPVARTGSAKAALDAISSEVMKGASTQDRYTVVTWCAPQYVEAMGRASGVPADEISDFVRALRPYNMFFVLSRTLSPTAGPKIETADEILSRIKFVDRFGKIHTPLKSDEIDNRAQSVADELATGFSNSSLMKRLGTKVTVVMFRSTDDLDRALADAANKGSFKITMDKLSIAWELPLDSVAKRGNSSKEK